MPLTREPVKDTDVVVTPLHTDWLLKEDTTGVGLTVMVNICDAPVQLFADGVTVIVAVFIEAVAFVAVNAAMLPEPLAPRPIDASLFVQLLVVPATELLKLIADVKVLLHTV